MLQQLEQELFDTSHAKTVDQEGYTEETLATFSDLKIENCQIRCPTNT